MEMLDQYRPTILMGRLLLGALWAGLLVVIGVTLMLDGYGPPAFWGGLAALASGQFIFMYVVAARIFHVSRRTPVTISEFIVIAVALLSLLVMTLSLLINPDSLLSLITERA